MTIIDRAMISVNSQAEYGILVCGKDGVNTLHHLNKNFDKINASVHQLVEVINNQLSGGRHYFVGKKDLVKDKTIFLVEIIPDYPADHLKWESKTFLEGYLNLHRKIRVHPVKLNEDKGQQYKPSLSSFESFVSFMHQAYQNDYQNWKLIESDLATARKVFSIPVLP